VSEENYAALHRAQVHLAQEQRRRFLQDTAENSARYASSFVTFTTHGWGERQSPNAQYFDTTFINMPSISHCMSLDGDALVDGRFPRVTAGVHRWVQNEKGHYIGAYLFFVIETVGLQSQSVYVLPTAIDGDVALWAAKAPKPPDPNYDIIHSFTFTGVAMKTLPSRALADLQ
jgi:hypothetical protein